MREVQTWRSYSQELGVHSNAIMDFDEMQPTSAGSHDLGGATLDHMLSHANPVDRLSIQYHIVHCHVASHRLPPCCFTRVIVMVLHIDHCDVASH